MPSNALPAPQRYRVPEKFGVAAILALTTAFGLVFGVLNLLAARPVFYAFFAAEGLLVCIVQMLFGTVPRSASALVGAALLPVWLIAATGGNPMAGLGLPPVAGVLLSIAGGAFLGYATGTVAAGIFMGLEWLQTTRHRTRP
jgi:hypothetical protein